METWYLTLSNHRGRDVGFIARSSYRKLSLIKCLISTFLSLIVFVRLAIWPQRSHPLTTHGQYSRLTLYYYILLSVCEAASLCFFVTVNEGVLDLRDRWIFCVYRYLRKTNNVCRFLPTTEAINYNNCTDNIIISDTLKK